MSTTAAVPLPSRAHAAPRGLLARLAAALRRDPLRVAEPCPFCGPNDPLDVVPLWGGMAYRVQCVRCGRNGAGDGDTPAAAVCRWNRAVADYLGERPEEAPRESVHDRLIGYVSP